MCLGELFRLTKMSDCFGMVRKYLTNLTYQVYELSQIFYYI